MGVRGSGDEMRGGERRGEATSSVGCFYFVVKFSLSYTLHIYPSIKSSAQKMFPLPKKEQIFKNYE